MTEKDHIDKTERQRQLRRERVVKDLNISHLHLLKGPNTAHRRPSLQNVIPWGDEQTNHSNFKTNHYRGQLRLDPLKGGIVKVVPDKVKQ